MDEVRFGGRAGPDGWIFEMTGGHPALDFANTLDERLRPEPIDLLPDYRTLLGWSTQAGILSREDLPRLAALAAARPGSAQACLRRARLRREEFFELFSAQAQGRPPTPASLASLNRSLMRAMSRLRLAASSDGVRWVFEHSSDSLDPMMSPLLRAAADLLVSPDAQRIRQCQGAGCAWLFLDRSRSGLRRWCDMTVCGNRAKAQRHRGRSSRPPANRPAGTTSTHFARD